MFHDFLLLIPKRSKLALGSCSNFYFNLIVVLTILFECLIEGPNFLFVPLSILLFVSAIKFYFLLFWVTSLYFIFLNILCCFSFIWWSKSFCLLNFLFRLFGSRFIFSLFCGFWNLVNWWTFLNHGINLFI